MGVSENGFVPHCTQWLMIIVPMKNGYFIGNIANFQTNLYIKHLFFDVLTLGVATCPPCCNELHDLWFARYSTKAVGLRWAEAATAGGMVRAILRTAAQHQLDTIVEKLLGTEATTMRIRRRCWDVQVQPPIAIFSGTSMVHGSLSCPRKK